MKEGKFPLEEKFLVYQQNIYPAMLESLAEDLGVKVESIKKLGVGFLPAEQAWIFAERDNKGHIIGLLRRYENGKKFIIEGGKRGLIYEAIGTKTKGKIIRQSKFIRIANANVCCPVCGKPDWCMVSDDDPSNPSTVLCSRIAEGAEKHIEGAGYLHRIRQSSKSGASNQVLSNSSKSTLVVEGASDVLAAMDMGYVAVGKPSAEGGNNLLVKLLCKRKVCIVGENDEAGTRGLETTFQVLKSKCSSVVKILPPAEFKDLREWHPTANEFSLWVQQNAIKELDSKFFDTKHPRPLALNWLQKTQIKNGQRLLHYHCPSKRWYQWIGSHYKEFPTEPLEEELYKYFSNREVLVETKFGKEFIPLNVNEYFIRNVKHALSRNCLIDKYDELQEPFWINGEKQIDITKSVVFRNGIYHILEDKLMPLSPGIFITSTLPFDFNPNARCERFLGTVEEDFSGDQECIDLLQEWFGYNTLASNFMQQMMFFYGRPGSGKTTIVNILQAMLGVDRCCAINIENLSDRFGLQSAIGKYSLIISEDRTSRKIEAAKILQRIKRITGGDWVPVEEKYKELRQIKPLWRITYDGNEMLALPDESGALYRRTNILYFPNVFIDNPDRELENKLIREIQGIAIWALSGLRRLLENKKFTLPKVSQEHIQDYMDFTNPMRAMIEHCCQIWKEPVESIKHWTSVNNLFELHRGWYEENNIPSMGRQAFGVKFYNTFRDLQKCSKRVQGVLMRGYEGIEILPDMFRRYIGGLK